MSRQNLSRSTTHFLGPVTYARAGSAKPGVQVSPETIYKSYGVIATAAAAAVAASQGVGAAGSFLINGSLASGGIATNDVPRNVVAAWTGTSVLTITGTDEYGSIMVEVTASGTSHTGKKAFKTITAVTSSAAITSATVGNGVVIGFPVRVDLNGCLNAQIDGVVDTTRTVVAADTSTATGTTGDVRGTISFASAPNGSRNFAVLLKIASISTKVGAYGALQFGSTDSV